MWKLAKSSIRIAIALTVAFLWQLLGLLAIPPTPLMAAASLNADVTVTYFLPGGLGIPYNLTITRLDANTINVEWSGYTPYYLLQVDAEDYITSPGLQQEAYYGATTSVNITWPYDNMEVYATLWGYAADNVTYTTEYAEAMAGGTLLTQIADSINSFTATFDGMVSIIYLVVALMVIIGLAALAYWRSDRRLFFISGLGFIVYGFSFWTINNYFSIIMVMAGIFLCINAFSKRFRRGEES